MKLQISRSKMLAACQLVGAATAARSPKVILQNVKAIAEADRLTMVATDLEVGIRYEVPDVQIEEPGEAMLAVGRLIAILRESSDEMLAIDADERRCQVCTNTSEFEMPSEDPSGFPDVAAMVDNPCFESPAGLLRTMIRRTSFAAAKQDTKYAITGILCEVDADKVSMIATDTRRLACHSGTIAARVDPKRLTALIPVKAMSLIERTMGDDAEMVRVSMRTNDVLFRTERATVYSRLLEGRFPPHRDIMPKKANAKIALSVRPFKSAVRQAAIMTDDDSRRVMFSFAPGKLTLQAQGAATGKSKVDMPLEFSGSPISINFDPHFLIDMLNLLDDDEALAIELTDAQKPALFVCGDEFKYLVMPLT